MDRKAGYKECPRCGLRNKPSALQCDFCGLRFIAGEDWDDNIQALEKMGGTEEKVLVDEDLSKRIEATIVKRDKINASPMRAKEPVRIYNESKKGPEPVRRAPIPIVTPSGPSIAVPLDTVIEASPEPRPAVPAPEPVLAVPATEKIIIEEHPPVVSPEEPLPKPVKEKRVVRRVVRPSRQVFTPVKSSMRKITFSAVLALGLLWYLVALLFGESSLGRPGGWVLVTFSSMMVVAGGVELLVPKTEVKAAFTEAAPEQKPLQEVLICPKCHEMVKETDMSCPDCGAEFRGE
jgi:hypothetical protein